MLSVTGGVRFWLVAGFTDMRRGMDGLSALVQTQMWGNVLSGQHSPDNPGRFTLRHGDYRNASTFTSVERETALSFLGQVLCEYIAWFKRNKLAPTNA